MRPRVDLVFLGLLIVVLGPVANLGATERGMNALKQKARTAGLPTRTDPQGTIGGGVGEFVHEALAIELVRRLPHAAARPDRDVEPRGVA